MLFLSVVKLSGAIKLILLCTVMLNVVVPQNNEFSQWCHDIQQKNIQHKGLNCAMEDVPLRINIILYGAIRSVILSAVMLNVMVP